LKLTCVALAVSLALSILAAPLAAEAQAAKAPRIGFLSTTTLVDPVVDGFRQGLREHGYIEGQNLLIEWRFAEGRGSDRLPGFATDLVSRKVEVIVTVGNVAAFAAKKATGTIPIVFAVVHEPVATGLVPSLARPEANVTGITQLGVELIGKRLELLKEAIASLKSVVIPLVRTEPLAERFAKEAQMAGRRLGLEIRPIDVHDIDDLQRAFRAVARESGAVCLVPSGLLYTHRLQIGELATKARVPLIGWVSGFVTSGALMSYGPSHFDAGRHAAGFMDKILKGAKPGDLPVEQPTKFELVINLKTAKALGLTIPPSLLLRADQVIE